MRRTVSAGQALIVVALVMPVLIGIAGLALDAGHLYFERRALQSIADAAAITGAQRPNYNVVSMEITAGGIADALANAAANGAQPGEAEAYVPPQTVVGEYYNGNGGYIEVVVNRQVDTWFMGLFGFNAVEVKARAVARSYIPGYGDAALIALADQQYLLNNGWTNRELFLTGSGSIVGDVISYGDIKEASGPGNYTVDGATYAYGGPAADLTASGGNYGNEVLSFVPAQDPMAQGIVAGTHAWPDAEFASLPGPSWTNRPIDPADCPPALLPCAESRTDANVSVGSGRRATLEPGVYGDITATGGELIFSAGLYIINKLTVSGGASVTGDGVLIKVNGDGLRVNIGGTGDIRFRAATPYSAVPQPRICFDPDPPDYRGPDCNTWMNIVFYLSGGVPGNPAEFEMSGNGDDRHIEGGIYAPHGHVKLNGEGDEGLIQGQVIANSVAILGNGVAIAYEGQGQDVTFGPILVNSPRI